jgi:hypothetical protein
MSESVERATGTLLSFYVVSRTTWRGRDPWGCARGCGAGCGGRIGALGLGCRSSGGGGGNGGGGGGGGSTGCCSGHGRAFAAHAKWENFAVRISRQHAEVKFGRRRRNWAGENARKQRRGGRIVTGKGRVNGPGQQQVQCILDLGGCGRATGGSKASQRGHFGCLTRRALGGRAWPRSGRHAPQGREQRRRGR